MPASSGSAELQVETAYLAAIEMQHRHGSAVPSEASPDGDLSAGRQVT
jgi:hypothetical protein